MTILNDLNAIYDRLNPILYYVVTEHVTIPGQVLKSAATDFFPEVYYVHPDDWARVHRELSPFCRLMDFRTWGGPARTTVDHATH